MDKKIGEWRKIVGVESLEEDNEAAAVGRNPLNKDMELTYRTTGLKISLKFDYRGKDGPDSFGDPSKKDGIRCYITAKLTDGGVYMPRHS